MFVSERKSVGAHDDGHGSAVAAPRDLSAREQLAGRLCLCRQHEQSVRAFYTSLIRGEREAGAQGIVDCVEEPFEGGEGGEGEGLGIHMREHPDGGGVEEYLGVRKGGEVGVTVLARAADHADGRRTFPRREGARGMRSPAAAEDDHAFAREGDPRRVQREPHAVEVGVVADQPAAAVYHGVDRAALPRGVVHLVEEGDDRPLVGDGDIHAVERFCREKA